MHRLCSKQLLRNYCFPSVVLLEMWNNCTTASSGTCNNRWHSSRAVCQERLNILKVFNWKKSWATLSELRSDPAWSRKLDYPFQPELFCKVRFHYFLLKDRFPLGKRCAVVVHQSMLNTLVFLCWVWLLLFCNVSACEVLWCCKGAILQLACMDSHKFFFHSGRIFVSLERKKKKKKKDVYEVVTSGL